MLNLIKNLPVNLPYEQKLKPANNRYRHISKTACDQVCFTSRVENNKKQDISFKSNNFILLGPPASGKGSLTEMMLKEMNVPHIDMGGMLRSAVKEGTELGKQAETYMKEGKLVPDEVVIGIVADRLSKDNCKNGFILDGFPRTIEQAKALDKILKENDTNVKVINIDLDIPKGDFLDRVVNRRICTNKGCGSVYNTKFKPPKEEGICDNCNSPLEHRKDDTEEVAMKRLETYEKQTRPLIEYYQAQGNLINTKASTGSKGIFEEIKDVLVED